MKTPEQLERDFAATVKMLLVEMEQLAALDPVVAAEPVEFTERRKRVIRKLRELYKEAVKYDPCTAV